MTQDFPGSNNLAYFQGRGKFGAMYRHHPSAGRYTYVAPNWWLRMVFRPEDDDIMPMMSEEGKECEPEFLIPILPMVLVNGCLGIATSVSTFVPAYNPMDIVQELKRKLTNGSPVRTLLVPYYRGFKGTVELLVDRKKEHREMLASHLIDEKTSGVKMSSRLRGPKKTVFDARTYESELPRCINAIQFCGCYQEKPGNVVRVTELPIGFAGEDYKILLDSWREEKRIKGFDNHSKVNSMDFTIYGVGDPTYQSLCLVRRMGITNQNLITPVGGFPADTTTALLKGENNERYLPEKYDDVYSILDTYMECRLHYYKIRKNNILSRMNMEQYRLKNKQKFIRLVLDGELNIQQMTMDVIESIMRKNSLPNELLDHTSIKAFTKEEVIRLSDKIAKLEQEISGYHSKSLQQIWLEELEEFEEAYGKHYKNETVKFSIKEDSEEGFVKNEMEVLLEGAMGEEK
jgi:DNA topoisomerase-2